MALICPMPGDLDWDCTVIASGWHTDDMVVALVLYSNAPYYGIKEITAGGGDDYFLDVIVETVATFENIVPAARYFDENYNLWGGS